LFGSHTDMWAYGRRHVEMRDETERKENDKKKVVERLKMCEKRNRPGKY